MPASPTPFYPALAELGQTAAVVGPRLFLALAVFTGWTLFVAMLRRRGAISRPLGGLVKWLAGLGLFWHFQHSLPPTLAAAADRLFTVGYLCLLWLAARSAIDYVYARFLPALGGGKPGRHILQDLVKFCILATLAAWGLKELLDIQLGSLLTSSAILTAVIGLSMQDTIGSLFSGLLLQVEKPFQEGDWIRAGDVEGRVSEVTWRYTKVVTIEANEVLLPNNVVAKERLVNFNRPEPVMRQILHVPAPPQTPPVAVKSAILTALTRAEGVAVSPAPAVRLHEIQGERLVYAAVYYITAFNTRLAVADAVLSAVWYQMLERGIDIPPPSRLLFSEDRPRRDAAPERMDALAKVELLAGMVQADTAMLARASVIRRFSPGQTIMAKGETGTTMFIILSGQVTVLSCERVLATLSPGQIFGEMALLTGEPRQADVRAAEAVTCLEVDREGFRMALAKHPVIVDRVREIFSQRAAANHRARPEASEEASSLFARFCKLFL